MMRGAEIFESFEQSEWSKNTRITETKNNRFEAIKATKLHKVTTRDVIFPYHDIVSWILSHVDIKTRTIAYHQETSMDSWKVEVLSAIYKLSPVEIHPNVDFLYNFQSTALKKCQGKYDIVIEDWLREEDQGFKLKAKKEYHLAIFMKIVRFLIKMLTKLHGEPDPEHYKIKWIPIIHNILNEGKCLNWVDILLQNITDSLRLSLSFPPRFKYIFCMSTYLIDFFFASVPFPLMKWNYPSDQQLPNQNYAPILWESNFKYHFYDICHYFLFLSMKSCLEQYLP